MEDILLRPNQNDRCKTRLKQFNGKFNKKKKTF